MRYNFKSVARDGEGNVVPSATVMVYLAGTSTEANVYTALTGGTAVHSVTTGSNGAFEFYVDNADYSGLQRFKIIIIKSSYESVTKDYLTIFDVNSVLDTDGTLAANSDVLIPTQKAVKTYADTKVFDVSSVLDTDGTLAANSDDLIATQKATKTYVNTYASSKISDDSYGAGWSASTSIAPSHRAVYDKIEAIIAGVSPQTIIPTGTKMIFYQDTAPTGWTLDNTLDDKVVYITKGSVAGGQIGGGVHSTGTWTQPNHNHTTENANVTVAAHTHGVSITSGNVSADHTHAVSGNTGTESADHSHRVGIYNGDSVYTGWGGQGGMVAGSNILSSGRTSAHTHSFSVTSGGISANHSHGVVGNTGSTGSGSGEHSHTVNASATANTWRPAAYCFIVCSKN